MLSKKAKYGIKAVAILAKEYGNGPLLIGEIAKRERIPSKFLELILLELKKKGFLQSKKGKGGGLAPAGGRTSPVGRAVPQRAGRDLPPARAIRAG